MATPKNPLKAAAIVLSILTAVFWAMAIINADEIDDMQRFAIVFALYAVFLTHFAIGVALLPSRWQRVCSYALMSIAGLGWAVLAAIGLLSYLWRTSRIELDPAIEGIDAILRVTRVFFYPVCASIGTLMVVASSVGWWRHFKRSRAPSVSTGDRSPDDVVDP